MAPAGEARCFAREHIEARRFSASAALAEQAVHCLELVAELARAGLAFQFKGGNSLLLILPEPRRFSIDVDIATDEPRESVDAAVDRAVRLHGVFKRWERRVHKTKPWLPLSSFYLFYDSLFAAPAETFIMLDVQLAASRYRTELKPVACGSLYSAPDLATLPLPSSIVGDKLLTVGPATLGIPVGKGKEAQRLKHVYDVSILLGLLPDLGEVRESFAACADMERGLQKQDVSDEAVFADTLAYCASTAGSAERPAPDPGLAPYLGENARGLDDFSRHLFDAGYGWRDLQRDMARVALCMTAVHLPSVSPEGFRLALERKARPSGRFLRPGALAWHPEARYYWDAAADWLGRDPLA